MAAVEDSAVTNFREYLRIPSVHPNVNYGEPRDHPQFIAPSSIFFHFGIFGFLKES
jgi:hypothetical protein